MAQYSEQDLEYAAEFREGIHREALAIVRRTRPSVKEVIDRHPVEDYFQEHWDYPGKWYAGFRGHARAAEKDGVLAFPENVAKPIDVVHAAMPPAEILFLVQIQIHRQLVVADDANLTVGTELTLMTVKSRSDGD